LRKPRSKNLDFYAEGSPNSWKIAPMLLINFVENAFKHSNLDTDEAAWIKIESDINNDGQLVFSIENSTSPSSSLAEVGGIGLQNVRRQLELNYPNDHSLTIKKESDVFYLQLKLQLKKA
jgi:LytS/YehU family sensor histidine kinase